MGANGTQWIKLFPSESSGGETSEESYITDLSSLRNAFGSGYYGNVCGVNRRGEGAILRWHPLMSFTMRPNETLTEMYWLNPHESGSNIARMQSSGDGAGFTSNISTYGYSLGASTGTTATGRITAYNLYPLGGSSEGGAICKLRELDSISAYCALPISAAPTASQGYKLEVEVIFGSVTFLITCSDAVNNGKFVLTTRNAAGTNVTYNSTAAPSHYNGSKIIEISGDRTGTSYNMTFAVGGQTVYTGTDNYFTYLATEYGAYSFGYSGIKKLTLEKTTGVTPVVARFEPMTLGVTAV